MFFVAAAVAQQSPNGPGRGGQAGGPAGQGGGPGFMGGSPALRPGQQLIRQGKLEEALAFFNQPTDNAADASAAQQGAGTVLDLLGRSSEAREHFQRAIDLAPSPQAKAQAERNMAMSYAFSNDCKNTERFENMVIAYWRTVPDFYQQGEMANEAARVCIEAGDLDTAERLYKEGTALGLQEPDIKPERVALWKFRLEHAEGRLAARRHNKAEAEKHVAAAKAILNGSPEMAKQQSPFFPYLTGYVAFYLGDYQAALTDFEAANQHDPFVQVLTAETYEKLGQKDKAVDLYREAASTTAHNPPAAYARPFATRKLKELEPAGK